MRKGKRTTDVAFENGNSTDLSGPFTPAILRFAVSFPFGYPESPPLITFVTDIFHPLVTPLTTYTYTTGLLGSDPVSATDEDRLPPGGFGLSHAFPHWFGKSDPIASSSVDSLRNVSSPYGRDDASGPLRSPSRENGHRPLSDHERCRVSIIDVLDYVKRAFDDEELLDGLPLEAAPNPGAWKAWQAHRRNALQHPGHRQISNVHSGALQKGDAAHAAHETQNKARRPEEWSWDGVWRERVRRGIDASISDQVLFGAGGGDDIVSLHLCQD